MAGRHLPDLGLVVPAFLFGDPAFGIIDAAPFRILDFESL